MEAAKGIDMCDSRVSYSTVDFTKDDLVSQEDPYAQFNHWFKQAVDCDAIAEPNAMAIATCSANIPSVRMVLMKWIGPNGLVFFTNQCSRKGRELEDNPNASVVFYWPPLHRQIRVEGKVKKLSDEESTKYFHSRPRNSQISANVSKQSSIIESKVILRREHERLKQKYADESVLIPKPPDWGGYIIKPSSFEFWQGHSDRLHDRIVFIQQSDSTWTVQLLAP